MKKFMVIILILLVGGAIIIAYPSPSEIEVNEGKNTIEINETFTPFRVSVLVENNEYIRSVTLIESYFGSNNSSRGYVNAFGGIGENFMIEPNKTYEIVSSKNKTIQLYENEF